MLFTDDCDRFIKHSIQFTGEKSEHPYLQCEPFSIPFDAIHLKCTFPSVAMTAYRSPLGEKITEVGVTLCCRKI